MRRRIESLPHRLGCATLAVLLASVFTSAVCAQNDARNLFIYFTDGSVKAFPTDLIKSSDTESTSAVQLTLINDSVVSYPRSSVDSLSYYGPEVPTFTSFKFNNKYNENLPYDVVATEITDTMVFSVPAIGKRLTPSFNVSSDEAHVYVGNAEQTSKESRLRFDHDIVYTVSLPGDSIFAMQKVKDEVWSEEVWSEEVWYEPIEEIALRPDMLSTNQPTNIPTSEDLDMMLDGDWSTYHQSTWGSGVNSQKSENVCLDIVLDEPVSIIAFYYVTRNMENYNPLSFTIWASADGSQWKEQRRLGVEDGMPTVHGNSEYTSPTITLDGEYGYLRFELTSAEHTKKQADGFVLGYLALAEFRLYKINGGERYLIKPSELIKPAELLEPAVWWNGMQPFGHDYTVRVDFLTDHAPGVPRIDIDIDGGQMVSSKEYYLHANFRLDGNGVYDNLEDSVWIKGRGNSSWAGTWGKSPYRLKFNEKVKPFGLTKGKSWCLIANAQRGSMMANAVGMKAARMMGTQGACHVIPVDLYINGDYRGSYTFTEKVGISNNSIDIDETTSYMLELDDYYDEAYRFRSTPYNLPVNLKEPDLTEEIYWEDAEERFADIKIQFNDFARAVRDQDGYEEMMDLDAFARFFMVNDLVNNMELGHPKSTFLFRENYADPESKYVFGPVWDLDWAFGYENSSQYYVRDATTSIFSKMTGQSGNNFFMALLDNSEEVRKAYYRVWVEFMRKYYEEFVEYPQDYLDYANSSYLTNANVWGDGRNYANQIAQIQTWFDQRTQWIMDNIEVFDLGDDTQYLSQGDVNWDGVYSVADVVCILGYLLGEKPEDFHFKQADVDKNGIVTVTDLVYVVEFVMNATQQQSAPRRAVEGAEAQVALQPFDVRLGETTDIDVTLLPVDDADEAVVYTGCEFIVTLPEGMTLSAAALTDSRLTHTVVTAPVDERHTRILIYSDTNEPLTPGSSLVRLTVSADAVISEPQRTVTLTQALIATPEGDEHKLHSTTQSFGLQTGIDNVMASCSAAGGSVLTITALQPTTVRVYRTDGVLVDTFSADAGTTTVELPTGIYIVTAAATPATPALKTKVVIQ